MRLKTSQLWTIDELGARVAAALSVNYTGPANGQARDVPDLRTIRYYTTLGLLDRPAEMRGRTALYRFRHLLQLVAIKRLQAQGMKLSVIQQELLGASDRTLRRLAQLPELAVSASREAAVATDHGRPPPSRRESFWKDPAAATPVESAPTESAEAKTASELLCNASGRESRASLHGVPLDNGVILLVNALRTIEPEDISALRVAAAPLLKLLETRRLLPSRNERGTA